MRMFDSVKKKKRSDWAVFGSSKKLWGQCLDDTKVGPFPVDSCSPWELPLVASNTALVFEKRTQRLCFKHTAIFHAQSRLCLKTKHSVWVYHATSGAAKGPRQ